jgi:hypothetical protein
MKALIITALGQEAYQRNRHDIRTGSIVSGGNVRDSSRGLRIISALAARGWISLLCPPEAGRVALARASLLLSIGIFGRRGLRRRSHGER